MRLLRLDLLAFGPFTDCNLTFNPSASLHLIHGPNEAGKTSALAALVRLFFGFQAQTPYNFLHSNRSLRVGATLRTGDGRERTIIRRKGRGRTLLDPAGRPLEDDGVLACLQGIGDQGDFERQYALTHDELVRGGEEIARGGGRLGEALFAAAGALPGLRAALDQLDADAANLFKPQGSRPPLNEAIRAYEAARRQAREAAVRSNEWHELRGRYETAVGEREALGDELRADRGELARLQRLYRAAPLINAWQAVTAELAAQGDIPQLPADIAERHRELTRIHAEARTAADEARRKLDSIAAERDALDVRGDLLAHEEHIETLADRRLSFVEMQETLPNLQGERDTLATHAAAIAARLPDAPQPEDIEPLSADGQARIHELAQQAEARQQAASAAERAVHDLRRRRDDLRRELGELPSAMDLGPLGRVIDDARAAGALGDQIAELRSDLEVRRAAFFAELRRLPHISLAPDALATLLLPLPERIDAFESDFDRLDRQAETTRTALAEADDALRTLDERERLLRTQAEPPTREAIEDARQMRDVGWNLIRRSWLENDDDSDARAGFIARFPPATDVAGAFERSIARADHLADERYTHAQLATQLAELQARRETTTKRRDEVAEQSRRLDQQRHELITRWRATWDPVGVDPGPPREMRAWLARCEALRRDQATLHEAADRLNRLQERHDTLCRTLTDALAILEVPITSDPDHLGDLLMCADRFIDAQRRLDQRRDNLTDQHAALSNELAVAETAQREAARARDDWRAAWAAALEPIGLEGDASPVQARAVLEERAALEQSEQRRSGLQTRIEQLEFLCEDYVASLRDLAGRIAPELIEQPPDQIAASLRNLLKQGRADRDRRATLDTRMGEQKERLERAESTVRHTGDQLDQLCQVAGCEAVAELPQAVARWQEHQRRVDHAQRLREQIAQHAPGGDVDALLGEVGVEDADRLPARIADLEQRIAANETRQGECGEEVGRLQHTLDQMRGTHAAADYAEQAEAHRARIVKLTDEYTRLRLAGAVLRAALERHRDAHQGPILTRAAQLFKHITLGSFADLAIDYADSDDGLLVGVRPDGRQVGVAGMSDGTCDQLYLALRLAGLEHARADREAIPFIIDDILIRFDDRRAAAALRVLADVARHHQVIFFTHHEHLIELARASVDDDALDIIELQSPTP